MTGKIFHLSVIVAVFAALYYSIRPGQLEPTLWGNPTPLRSLEGVLAPNNILSNVVRFHEGLYKAPESIAFRRNGDIFTGLADGRVVSFSKTGEFIREVFFTGEFLKFSVAGGLRTFCKKELDAKRLAWNPTHERLCGRPLGLRVHNDPNGKEFLYIVDAYHGIFQHDLETGKTDHIVTVTTPIQTLSSADPVASAEIKFFNDLDVKSDGTIIFTDSSYKCTRSENRIEILDGAPRGRVLQFKPNGEVEEDGTVKGELRPLLCGLHFPNGVQLLSPTEVLVVEATRFRILRLNLASDYFSKESNALSSCLEEGSLTQLLSSAPPTSQSTSQTQAVSIFLDSAPGFLDNIRPNHFANDMRGPTFYVGVGTKSTTPFSLLWSSYQSMILRDIVGKFLPMQLVEHLVPRYGLVIEVDGRGEIIASLHDPTGGMLGLVSEAQRHPITGDMWLGSHSNAFLAMLPAVHFTTPSN